MSMHHEHPTFCDPRCCAVLSEDNVEHRSTPLSFKPTAADVQLTIGLSRLDEVVTFRGPVPTQEAGSVRALLVVDDLESCTPKGDDRLIEVDLTGADARLLAAALLCAAEQLETMTAVTR